MYIYIYNVVKTIINHLKITINRLCKPFPVMGGQVGAYLMADIAHISGLVATGEHPSPFPFCDVAWLIKRDFWNYTSYTTRCETSKKSSLMFQTTHTGFGILKNKKWFRYETSISIISMVGLWSFIWYIYIYIQFWICLFAYSRFNIPVEVVTTTTHKSLRGAYGDWNSELFPVFAVLKPIFFKWYTVSFPINMFIMCNIM